MRGQPQISQISILWAATCCCGRLSGRCKVVKGPAVELLNSLCAYQGQVSYLLASLSDRVTRMTHFADQFLRRFSIFTQPLGSLFEHPQHLADATLLLPLHVGQFPYAVAARHQVANDDLELAPNRLVLLPFRTIYNFLQACYELIDLRLTISTSIQK